MQIPGEHGRTWPVKCNITSVVRNENQNRKERRREGERKKGRAEEGRREGKRKTFVLCRFLESSRVGVYSTWHQPPRVVVAFLRHSGTFVADLSYFRPISRGEIFFRGPNDRRRKNERWTSLNGISTSTRGSFRSCSNSSAPNWEKYVFSNTWNILIKKIPVWNYMNVWESCNELLTVDKSRW